MRKNILISFIALLFLVGCNKENSNTSTNASSSNSSGFYANKFIKIDELEKQKDILRAQKKDNEVSIKNINNQIFEIKEQVANQLLPEISANILKQLTNFKNSDLKDIYTKYYSYYKKNITQKSFCAPRLVFNDVDTNKFLTDKSLSNNKNAIEFLSNSIKKCYSYLYLVEFEKIITSKIPPLCSKIAKEVAELSDEARNKIKNNVMEKALYGSKVDKFDFKQDMINYLVYTRKIKDENQVKEICLNSTFVTNENFMINGLHGLNKQY